MALSGLVRSGGAGGGGGGRFDPAVCYFSIEQVSVVSVNECHFSVGAFFYVCILLYWASDRRRGGFPDGVDTEREGGGVRPERKRERERKRSRGLKLKCPMEKYARREGRKEMRIHPHVFFSNYSRFLRVFIVYRTAVVLIATTANSQLPNPTPTPPYPTLL